MRYIKALVLVCVIFACMIFLFQNQESLSQTIEFQLDLLAIPPMTSIKLPFYFVMLAAFLVGALSCLCILLWDRVRLSARIMQANWKVSSLESEQKRLMNQMERLGRAPKESRPGLLSRFMGGKGKAAKDEPAKAEAEVASAPAEAKPEVNEFFQDGPTPAEAEQAQATEPAPEPAAEQASAPAPEPAK